VYSTTGFRMKWWLHGSWGLKTTSVVEGGVV
jgi:hypothetical protein